LKLVPYEAFPKLQFWESQFFLSFDRMGGCVPLLFALPVKVRHSFYFMCSPIDM
jgi:hypothetical protein